MGWVWGWGCWWDEEGLGGVRLYSLLATPARAVVAMVTGRAEAEPPPTYPIRVR